MVEVIDTILAKFGLRPKDGVKGTGLSVPPEGREHAKVGKLAYTDPDSGVSYYNFTITNESGKVIRTEIRPFMAE